MAQQQYSSAHMRDAHLAELDLHGLTKEKAIRAVTDFIEVNKHNNVRIITGTGSHSTHGPVLRTAVESLLTRRNMIFNRAGAGSFIVNCSSGDTFYPPEQPKDTKVIVLAQPTSPAQRAVSFAEAIPQAQSYSVPPNRTRRVVSTTTTKRIRNADGSTEETTSIEERIIEGEDRQEQVYAECIYADDANCGQRYVDTHDPVCGPWITPAEAKTEESDYYKALEGSLEDYKKEKMASQHDSMEVDRALQLSLKLFEEQEAKQREQERAELEKILLLSEKAAAEETKKVSANEEELFLLALERSKSETKASRIADDEEEELKRILELSKKEAYVPQLGRDEEEEMIRKALEESQMASRRCEDLPDRELEEAIRRAMEESLEEDRRQREEENELMRQIMGMSLR